MAFTWDPEQGQWVDVDDAQFQQLQAERAPDSGLTMEQEGRFSEAEQARLSQLQQADPSLKGKPLLSGNPGDWAADAALIAGNAFTGLATDFGDLVSYVGDVAGYAVDSAMGDESPDRTMFDDTDNPWTQWRINTFEKNYRTEAAQGVGDLVRLGSALLVPGMQGGMGRFATIPFRGGAKAANIVTGGKAGKFATAIGNRVEKLPGVSDLLKLTKSDPAELALSDKGMADLVDTLRTGGSKGAKTAAASLQQDWWLRAPLKDLGSAVRKRGVLGNGVMDDIDRYASAVGDAVTTQFKAYKNMKGGVKIRTLGEAMGWDALASFNVAGEGNDGLDETFADAIVTNFGDFGGPDGNLAGWLLSNTTTYQEDVALTRKWKGVMEGMLLGSVLNVAFDTARIWRYSKNLQKASPQEQMRILDAFSKEANDIGMTVADMQGPRLANGANPGEAYGQMGPAQGYTANPWAGPAPQSDWLQNLSRVGADVTTARRNLPPPMLPANYTQYAGQIGPGPASPLTSPANLTAPPSPVQNRLAEMEGLASPVSINDDPLYQQWLSERASSPEDFMPPATGDNPVQRQFQDQGPMPGPDETAQYKAWLEANAMGNEQMRPEVQAALKRLEDSQALATVPEGQAPGQMVPQQDIIRARVEDITPRPPEPVVSPQTMQGAFVQDLMRNMEGVLAQAPEGVFGPVMDEVTKMLPRSRSDAIDYLKSIGRRFNQERVLPLFDGLISDAVYQKGLGEGWIRMTPEGDIVGQMRGAVDNDEFSLLAKQGDAIEMANANVDISESYRIAQQEQPLEVDVNQSVKAAEQEMDVYDQMAQDALNRDAVGANDQLLSYRKGQEGRVMAAPDVPTSVRTDDEVLREYLGNNEIPVPDVVRMEKGRGYQVVDESGEVLGQARTQRAARELQERAVQARRQEMVRAARQIEMDGEYLSLRADDPLELSSRVTGSVKFTDAQMRMVGGLDPELARQMDEAWGGYTGGDAFFNTDGKKLKRSYEMNQVQMDALARTIRQGVEDGSIEGARVKPLLNLAEKLETNVKLLSAEASTQKWAETIAEGTIRLLTDGKICDLY
jgi:hypothetical protein